MADPGRSSEGRRAAPRIARGQAQMAGAVVSIVCLVQTGMTDLAPWAVGVTGRCLVASLILFRKRGPNG